MAEYKNYLAVNILTEDKTVTYRLLSRALKVHVNTAKEMLYDFHRQQNAKKPGTLHATYLLSGIKREEPLESTSTNGEVKKDGEDDYMQSSPFMASSMPQIEERMGATSVLSITLVQEESLEETKSQYTHISSIHIYSLSPAPVKDLQVLSDITRQIQTLASSDDPLEANQTYGTITNPLAKRRTNRRPPPPPIAAPIATKSSSAPSKAAVKTEAPKLSRQDSSNTKSSQPSSAKDFFGKSNKNKVAAETGKDGNASSKESTPAPALPALKRESSSIFKAFAKKKEPIKKKEEQDDVAMSDDGDDDGEETYVPPLVEEKEGAKDRKSRKDREDALRKMMDDDSDDEQESKVATPAEAVKDEDVEMNEEVEGDEEDLKAKTIVKKEASEEPEPSVTVSDGRRRGKRRVMKKKTVKDEEGYLVTHEEAVWESFSEDEPAPKFKPKPQPAASASTKTKKAAGKAGQGSIMSFFGKK